MKFLVKEKTRKRNFSFLYNKEELSFYIRPDIETGWGSISINFLEFELNEEGRVLYIHGYEPLMKYKETEHFPRSCENSDLVVILDNEPSPDSFPGNPTYKLVKCSNWPEAPEWPTYINKQKGWVCVGDPTTIGRRMVEFAPDCIASLDSDNEMVAVWLHPKELPSHVFGNSLPSTH